MWALPLPTPRSSKAPDSLAAWVGEVVTQSGALLLGRLGGLAARVRARPVSLGPGR